MGSVFVDVSAVDSLSVLDKADVNLNSVVVCGPSEYTVQPIDDSDPCRRGQMSSIVKP